MTGVALLGIPVDANSSHLFGARHGPDSIRRVLHSGSGNDVTEAGVDVVSRITDLGDLTVDNQAGSVSDAVRITDRVAAALDVGSPLIVLGGDHSITYPVLRAYRPRFDQLTVVHVDAHPDLYDDLDGNPLSHASPFARALENDCMDRLIQLGIRTATPHQLAQSRRWNVEMVPARSIDRFDPLDVAGPIYLSIDLDGLDPSVAPGVSHHEPGGLSVRELLNVIDGLAGRLIGADIVELNPDRDVVDMTAAVAAKLVKEVAGALLSPAP